MNEEIYLVECMVIVAIMMVFNRLALLEDILVAFLIVLVQIGFDRLRRRK